jgi:hypothetical protein
MSAETAPDTACVAGKLLTETLVTGLVTVTLAVGEKAVTDTPVSDDTATELAKETLPDTATVPVAVQAEIAMSSPIVRSPDTAIGVVLDTSTLAVGENDVTDTPVSADTES